jgi:hypothetical protein
MPTSTFDDLDLEQLKKRGISLDEIQHQLLCFQNPPNHADLVRPCTVGDGIRRIEASEHDGLLDLHARAAAAGRISKFVPASGAATRMFRSAAWLRGQPRGRRPDWSDLEARAERDDRAAEIVTLVRNAARLPFRDELSAALGGDGALDAAAREGGVDRIVEALLAEDALALADRPKGLIPFHRYEDGEARTAFEEHLVEATATVREREGLCRLHLTVSAEHLEAFAALLRRVGARYADRHDVAFDVSYSVQRASTDTIAVDAEGRPVRDPGGRILFRPGGHGALIENLDDLRGDIVLVKNIDNVQRDRDRHEAVLWKRLLVGVLVRVQSSAYEALHRLKGSRRTDPDALAEATALVRDEFGIEMTRSASVDPARARAWLMDRLERPVRVCGVVPNTGEPGGGPFWVRDADGVVGLQIVETAQIDPDSDEQQRLLARSTHFNPVDLVCGMRDAAGEPYVLPPLVDADAVIVTRKSLDGREVKVLERPGLWNGAMAGWNTVFVEVPLATFTPVKTVLDLLRPEHQP